MKYRYILDNIITLVDESEAMGWSEMTSTITRDRQKRGLIVKKDITLELTGKGYDYIHKKFYNEGYCSLVNIKIQRYLKNTWSTIYEGILFLRDVEFLEGKGTCTAKIEDNNFSARIENNKNIECYLFAGKSKNGVDITAAEFYRVTYFNPVDGVLNLTPQDTHGNNAYRVFEAFRYMIAYMSDDKIEFQSSLFDVGGKWEGLCITFGYILNFLVGGVTQSSFEAEHPKLSFEKLFTEISKKCNLGFIIESGGAKPILRIEEADYLFQGDNSSVSFTDVDRVKTKVDINELFSVLKLGGEWINESQVDSSSPNFFASSADWVGFKREDFTLAGECNIERPLDLQGEWVVDNNLIADVMGFNASGVTNKEHQQQWFIIETEYVSDVAGNAVVGDPFVSGPPYMYNPSLRNSEVANNFLGYIPNDVVSYLSQQTGGLFEATKVSSETLFTPMSNPPVVPPVPSPNPWYFPQIICELENFDDGGNYDPLTGDYTVPFSGKLTFTVRSNIRALATGISYYIGIGRFSGATLLQAPVAAFNWLPVTNYLAEVSQTFICNAGDVIRFYHAGRKIGNFTTTPYLQYFSGSVLSCTFVEGGGGEYLGADPTAYRALIHEFSYPLSFEQYKAIEENPRGLYDFNMSGEPVRKGFIDKIKFNEKNTEADIVLVSSLNSNA